MKSIRNKILILFLLSVFIVVSSIVCYADEKGTGGVTVSSSDELYEVLGGDDNLTKSGDEIILLNDVTVNDAVVLDAGEYVVSGAGVNLFASKNSLFVVNKGTTLVLGSDKTADDGITFCSTENENDMPYITVEEGGKLIIKGNVTFSSRYTKTVSACIVNRGTVLIENVLIENCRTSGFGGAVSNEGEFSFLRGKIKDCSSENGGAIYNGNSMSLGTCEIHHCTAQKGGAIYNVGNFAFGGAYVKNPVAEIGGAVYNDGILSFDAGQIDGAVAEIGGAVFNTQNGQINMTSCYINLGSAKKGGLVYNDGTFVMHDGTLTDGYADLGGCFYNNGDFDYKKGFITSGNAKLGGGIFNSGKLILSGGGLSLDKADYGKAVFNYGELRFCEFPRVDENYDVCIVVSENGKHIPYIDSEMKAEKIACLSFVKYDGEIISDVDYTGLTALQGSYSGQGSNHFIVKSVENSNGVEKYYINDGVVFKQLKIYEQIWFYVVIAVIYILIIVSVVYIGRYFDSKSKTVGEEK